MAPEQDWCLECGDAATTRVLAPPSWRLPAAIVLASLALLGGIVALTVALVSDDARDAAGDRATAGTTARATQTTPERRRTSTAPRRATAPAATTPTRATTATTPTSTVPGAAEAAGRGPVAVWPRDREAYTVVIVTTDRAGATQRARELIRDGEDAGILRTNGYDFFSPGTWIAWAGEYPDKPRAQAAAQRLSRKYSGAYATLVRRSR